MSIGSLTSIASALPGLTAPAAPAAVSTTSPTGSGGSFAESVGGALANLEAAQQKADGLGQGGRWSQLLDRRR